MSRRLVTLASVLVISSVALIASAAKFKKISGEERATCDVIVPGFSFTGKVPGSAISASDSGDVITVTVGLADIDTGIGMRTKDLKNALKSKTATFTVKKSELKMPSNGQTTTGGGRVKVEDGKLKGNLDGSLKGGLSLNGSPAVTTPFAYAATRSGSHVTVTAMTVATLSKHQLKFCAPGDVVCVKDEMRIDVRFKLAEE